jgi:hypothetical protein
MPALAVTNIVMLWYLLYIELHVKHFISGAKFISLCKWIKHLIKFFLSAKDSKYKTGSLLFFDYNYLNTQKLSKSWECYEKKQQPWFAPYTGKM